WVIESPSAAILVTDVGIEALAAVAVDSVPVTTRVAAAIVTRVRRTRVDMRMGGLLDDSVDGAITAHRKVPDGPVSGADLIPQDRSAANTTPALRAGQCAHTEGCG